MGQAPQPWRTYKIDKCICPHCNRRQDLRELDFSVDDHPAIACDLCGNYYRIVNVERTTLISIRPMSQEEFRKFKHS